MENRDYEIIRINENTWRIENTGVRFFLLAGSKEALLIDCGMTVRSALEIVKTLTALPVRLLITHADMDHIGCIAEFDRFYMHPAEAAFYYGEHPDGKDYDCVADGDVIDLGGRPLKIIYLPGHTPGSIAVLDIANRVLISGDPVQDGDIYMFGPQREMRTYIKSLERLRTMTDEFDEIYPSHATFPVKPELIDTLLAAAKEIQAGKRTFVPTEAHGFPVKKYDVSAAVFLTD